MSIIFESLNVEYLNGKVNVRQPVRLATVTSGTLSNYTDGNTLDGLTLVDGDRILVKNQSTDTENGVYLVTLGSPERTFDFITPVNGIVIHVLEGTNAHTSWTCVSPSGLDTVDTDPILFSQTDLYGTLPVSRGGLGVATLGSGNVLVGNGTSAVTSTKAAPSGDFVGTSDSQILTNKTLTSPLVNTNSLSLTSLTNSKSIVFQPGGSNSTSTTFVSTQTSNIVINLPDSSGTLATTAYADSVAQGLNVKSPVKAASTGDLTLNADLNGAPTYNASGGATSNGQFTATLLVSGVFNIDGVAILSNDRILFKNQTSGLQNGVWYATISGLSLTLDRTTDYDTSAKVGDGDYIWVEQGATTPDTAFVLTTNNPITLNSTSLVYEKFSRAEQIVAGNGITKSGTTLSANLKANGGLTFETGSIAVDLGASSITGTLAYGDGGTGATSLTNGNVLVAGASAVTTTKAAPSGDFVGTSDSQTLTNKTLTAPVVDKITSANGDVLNFSNVASGVNYVDISNSISGASPKISSAGSDTNISLELIPKGTGTIDVKSGGVKIYDSSNAVTLKAPTLSASYNFTLPVDGGTNGYNLVTNGSGVTSWAAPSASLYTFSLVAAQINVNTTSYTTIATFAWKYTGTSNRVIIFEVANYVDRSLSIQILDVTNATTLMSVTGITTNSFRSDAFTAPSSDARLAIQVRKSAAGGTNPQIYGLQMQFSA